MDLTCIVNLAFGYYYTQRFEKALEYNAIATNMAPEAAWNHLTKAFIIFAQKGANIESRQALEKVDKDHDWCLYGFYFQELFEGNIEAIPELLEKYPRGIDNKLTRAPKELLEAYIHTYLDQQESKPGKLMVRHWLFCRKRSKATRMTIVTTVRWDWLKQEQAIMRRRSKLAQRPLRSYLFQLMRFMVYHHYWRWFDI